MKPKNMDKKEGDFKTTVEHYWVFLYSDSMDPMTASHIDFLDAKKKTICRWSFVHDPSRLKKNHYEWIKTRSKEWPEVWAPMCYALYEKFHDVIDLLRNAKRVHIFWDNEERECCIRTDYEDVRS